MKATNDTRSTDAGAARQAAFAPRAARVTLVTLAVAASLGALTTALRSTPVRAQAAGIQCHLEWATMRDGVALATEVYLPADASGPLPVILQRTPYNRAYPDRATDCDNPQFAFLASQGYAALNQDVRGRYRSGGAFDPMVQEAADGYDAVEWAAAQPWSSGKVGMIGGSYGGVTQWQAAVQRPPHLAAIAPLVTASDLHDHWTYANGVFDLWFAQSWLVERLASEGRHRELEANGRQPAAAREETATWTDAARRELLSRSVWTLPLDAVAELRALAPYYAEWLRHPAYDRYWAALDLETRYGEVTVPSLNLGFWYDIFQIGTVRNFQGVRAGGGSPEARDGSKLVMWAGCHDCPDGTTAGSIDFGPENQVNLNQLYVRWFDRWLKEIQNGIDAEPAVRLFVMVPPDAGNAGSGFWVESEEFPLRDTRPVRYHLRSGGNATTRRGDGVLSREGSAGPPDSFVYDPRNPVPTVGGNMCCIDELLPSGAFDQSSVEDRHDVLVYTSEPLAEDAAVVGAVKVAFWATTSARDTDFTAKLVDVHPDGVAHNVLDRIVRARFRAGSKRPPSRVTPGVPHDYTIDLGFTASVFRAGHRIRLEISSSNFPHYARNDNTGDLAPALLTPLPGRSRMRVARQTILHDAEHPSYVELPVVPGLAPAP